MTSSKIEDVKQLIMRNETLGRPSLEGVAKIYPFQQIPKYETIGRSNEFIYVNKNYLFGLHYRGMLVLSEEDCFSYMKTEHQCVETSIIILNEDIETLKYIILSKIDCEFLATIALSSGNAEIVRLLLNNNLITIDSYKTLETLFGAMLCETETYKNIHAPELLQTFIKQLEVLNWVVENYPNLPSDEFTESFSYSCVPYEKTVEDYSDMLNCMFHFLENAWLMPEWFGPCVPFDYVFKHFRDSTKYNCVSYPEVLSAWYDDSREFHSLLEQLNYDEIHVAMDEYLNHLRDSCFDRDYVWCCKRITEFLMKHIKEQN